MKLSGFAATVLLATSATAVPGSYQYPNCKVDQCLKSVNLARNDCNLFLATTIVPCPTTVTKTKTITTTKPKTTTLSRTISTAVTKTVTTSVTTTVTTILDLVTKSVPSQVLLTSTVVVPATITLGNVQKKRKVAEVCSAKTISATALPACAKACSTNKARISSACSCIGVGPKTLTAKRSTSTVTVTASVTDSPTVTVTKVQTITATVTEEQTSVIPASLLTTATTEVASLFTDFTTVSVTSTTTVAAPACSGFYLYGSTGSYVASGSTEGSVGRVSAGRQDLALKLELRGTTLYKVGTALALGAAPVPETGSVPLQLFSLPSSSNPLICNQAAGSSAITCQTSDGYTAFAFGSSSSAVGPLFVTRSPGPGVGFGQMETFSAC